MGRTPEGGALGKADTHTLRVALALAEMEQPGARDARISLDVLERAIAVVDFSIACWAHETPNPIIGLTYKDGKLDAAVDTMRAWLRDMDGDWVPRATLANKKVGGRYAAERAEVFNRYALTYPYDVQRNTDGKLTHFRG
jgi:hypothetical protein